MKIKRKIQPKKCPRCGNIYRQPPALSRVDGITAICPDCGTREALESIGVEVEEQEKRKGINKDKSNQGLCLFIPPPFYLYIAHIQYGRILDYPWIFLNRRI